MNLRKLLCMVSVAALLAACGSKDDDAVKPPRSPEELYSEALDDFNGRKYKDAVKAFEEVERQHPASEWATNSQIMSAYSSYEAQDYPVAIATLERFTKLYPSNESTPYAYYMIALCYYEQINDVGRDQKVTEQAMQGLREVIRRFPESEYARDAKIKLDLTQDHLAGKEMEIGRYYLRQDNYLAAINRFRFVVENFQTTSHVPEALHRLVEGYLRLGVRAEAEKNAAVLGHNFPGSVWYRDSYKLMTGVAKQQPEAAKADEKKTEAADAKSGSKETALEEPKEEPSFWDSILP